MASLIERTKRWTDGDHRDGGHRPTDRPAPRLRVHAPQRSALITTARPPSAARRHRARDRIEAPRRAKRRWWPAGRPERVLFRARFLITRRVRPPAAAKTKGAPPPPLTQLADLSLSGPRATMTAGPATGRATPPPRWTRRDD